MNNFVISQIRTYVPILVGALLSRLAMLGIEVSAGEAAALATFLNALFSSAYYLAVRLLEEKFPKLGWLLGSPAKPQYVDDTKEKH